MPLWPRNKSDPIPHILWQNNCSDRVTLPLYLNYWLNRLMSPGYEYRFMDNNECEAFIRENCLSAFIGIHASKEVLPTNISSIWIFHEVNGHTRRCQKSSGQMKQDSIVK